MAQSTDAKQLCNILDTELNKVAGCLYSSIETGRQNYGTARAIEAHTRTDLTRPISARFTKKDLNCTDASITVQYKTPDCDDSAMECSDVQFNCSHGETERDTWKECPVTIDDCVAYQFSLDFDEINCDCQNNENLQLVSSLQRAAQKMAAQYNKKLAAAVVGGVGQTYGGEDYLKLKLLKEVDGCLAPNAMGPAAIAKEYQKQAPNCALNPFIVTGSEKVFDYNYAINNNIFANTNSDAQNAQSLNGVYYDPELAALLATSPMGVDGAISVLPGSLSLLEVFHFENATTRIGTGPGGRHIFTPVQANGNSEKIIVRQKVDLSPFLGFRFVVDMEIVYDFCASICGKVTYKFKKCFGLFKLPQDALCPGSTHNYCVGWKISCEPYTCEDSCTVVPGAETETKTETEG